MNEENKSIFEGKYGDLAKAAKARFWKEHTLDELLAILQKDGTIWGKCYSYVSSIISDYLHGHFWKVAENQMLGIDNELALTGLGVNECITADILWSVLIHRAIVSAMESRRDAACKRVVYDKVRRKHLFKIGNICGKLGTWSNKRFLKCCSPSKRK